MNRSKLCQKFLTKKRLPVFVRHIKADEAHLLVDLFEHLSTQSRYHRFHQHVDHVGLSRIWQEAAKIAEGDELGDVCLVAFVEGAPIAAARYTRTGVDSAEIAMSVRDEFQGQGVGKQLLLLLRAEAIAAGLVTLTATVQNENESMLHLLQLFGWPMQRILEGTTSTIILSNPTAVLA